MDIFKIIKNFIDKITNRKLKLLAEGASSNYTNTTKIKNIEYMNETSTKVEDNKKEENQIKNILLNIGCKNEIFEKIKDYSKINLDNLNENLKILTKFKYNKLEFSKIFTENTNLLFISNNELKKNIKNLNNIFEKQDIKHLIYSTPTCLTNDLTSTFEILKKYEVPDFVQKYILLENPTIFQISKVKLEEQIEYIKNACHNFEEFIFVLMCMSIYLGTNQLDLVTNYIK